MKTESGSSRGLRRGFIFEWDERDRYNYYEIDIKLRSTDLLFLSKWLKD